jgi:hypothetical protein
MKRWHPKKKKWCVVSHENPVSWEVYEYWRLPKFPSVSQRNIQLLRYVFCNVGVAHLHRVNNLPLRWRSVCDSTCTFYHDHALRPTPSVLAPAQLPTLWLNFTSGTPLLLNCNLGKTYVLEWIVEHAYQVPSTTGPESNMVLTVHRSHDDCCYQSSHRQRSVKWYTARTELPRRSSVHACPRETLPNGESLLGTKEDLPTHKTSPPAGRRHGPKIILNVWASCITRKERRRIINVVYQEHSFGFELAQRS